MHALFTVGCTALHNLHLLLQMIALLQRHHAALVCVSFKGMPQKFLKKFPNFPNFPNWSFISAQSASMAGASHTSPAVVAEPHSPAGWQLNRLHWWMQQRVLLLLELLPIFPAVTNNGAAVLTGAGHGATCKLPWCSARAPASACSGSNISSMRAFI